MVVIIWGNWAPKKFNFPKNPPLDFLKLNFLSPALAVLERIIIGLCSLYAHGWTPPRLSDDPVVRMPRKHSKTADGLADYTMDIQTSWAKEFDITANPRDTNIAIQTDGGKRLGNTAAASVVVGIFDCGEGTSTFQP